MKSVADYIKVFPGLAPGDLVDSILDEYGNSNLWSPASTYADTDKYRTCSVIPISDNRFKTTSTRELIDDRIFHLVSESKDKYREDFPFIWVDNDCGYDLLRYEVGQHYDEHVDAGPDCYRALSLIVNLSSAHDYTGGDLSFTDGPSFHLGRGDVVIFPSSFVFPHRITPVKSGVRHSIVTWMS